MGVGVASSGSGGQGFAFRLEGDGDSKIGNSDGDLHQVTGTLQLNENVFILANGKLGLGDSDPSHKLSVGGSMEVGQYIYHKGDNNTFINFTDNRVRINAGGNNHIDCEDKSSAPHKVRINNGGNDIDFIIKDNSNNQYFTADASTSRIGIGTDTPAAPLSVAGVISSSHGATLGNLILQDDTTSLQVSGTISSSAGATLGNLILQDDATSLQLSGAVLMSDKGAFGNTAIYDATGSSVTRVTGTLDIKGHHVQAITRTDLGNGATSTITGTTGIHFLDASEVTTGAGGAHVITVSTGTLDGQYLVLAITGTIANTTIIAGNTSVAASGEITFTGTASDNQTLTLKDTSGNSKTVTTSTSVSCGTNVRGDASSQVAGINGCPNAAFTAAAIYTAIAAGISSDSWPFTLDPGFSAGTDTSFTISQNVVGAGGNQTITSNLSNVSVTGFSGGGVSLGTVNSDNGISMGYGQINGPVVHLVFDTRSNQWQPISANHITS